MKASLGEWLQQGQPSSTILDRSPVARRSSGYSCVNGVTTTSPISPVGTGLPVAESQIFAQQLGDSFMPVSSRHSSAAPPRSAVP
ncbi:hypothetical protein DQK91_23660 [Oceanidesulfovibrio marinus]|uniref:Uncharacterized protein n=2 Tax=Oceanidesulfovibrio marinus TaxID=370038 RepID=A0A6P1ZD79_9BACT|nr:hypothetical protein DQK91_23660 [Oceanidesulfovibrio marinus]